jgi:DNA-binding FadR family transcriptional regulator
MTDENSHNEAAEGGSGNPRRGRRPRLAGADAFEPVHSRRAFDAVIDQILEQIRGGQLREGDALPSERTMAAAMDVSRKTIREAVRILADGGVLSVTPGAGGGIYVDSIWIPQNLTQKFADLHADEIFSVLEARRALEPRLALLAGVRATDEDFAALEEAIELHREHQDRRTRAVQAEALFHRVMWRAAHNTYLEGLMRSLFPQLSSARDMAQRTETDVTDALILHERTLEAVKRGESEGIEAVMDDHLAYLERICEDALGRPRFRSLPDFLTSRN